MIDPTRRREIAERALAEAGSPGALTVKYLPEGASTSAVAIMNAMATKALAECHDGSPKAAAFLLRCWLPRGALGILETFQLIEDAVERQTTLTPA